MKNKNIFQGIKTVAEIKESPKTFVLDIILATALSALIPIPFLTIVIVKYKGLIISIVVGIVFFLTTLILLTGIAFITPIMFLIFPYSSLTNTETNFNAKALHVLDGYIDTSFENVDIPKTNPFGGISMFNTFITVKYNENEDFEIKGIHYNEFEKGIDIVPDGLYFLTNKAAGLTGLPIVFSTMNGTANSYTDQYGALYIVIVNNERSLETLYIHLSNFLIEDNVHVQAGEPIGVMGSTGLSTGPHLEYQVRLNQEGKWVNVNPVSYIH